MKDKTMKKNSFVSGAFITTLGIVISGVQYLTARDNEAQMTKAKSRLINIVIGLAIYAVMWGFLQWILPGGIFRG